MDVSQSPSAEDDMHHSGQHGRFPLPDSFMRRRRHLHAYPAVLSPFCADASCTVGARGVRAMKGELRVPFFVCLDCTRSEDNIDMAPRLHGTGHWVDR